MYDPRWSLCVLLDRVSISGPVVLLSIPSRGSKNTKISSYGKTRRDNDDELVTVYQVRLDGAHQSANCFIRFKKIANIELGFQRRIRKLNAGFH